MATLLRSVLCHRVITDQETNSVTLVDCIERLAPKKLPARLPRVILATLWQRKHVDADGDTTRARVRLVGPAPDEEELAEHELPELDFHEGQERLRLNLNLQGLEVRAAGMHHITIETLDDDDEWRLAASTTFEIVEPPAPDEEKEDTADAA
jgi:hypothetical protein